jgi:hypothetical protein
VSTPPMTTRVVSFILDMAPRLGRRATWVPRRVDTTAMRQLSAAGFLSGHLRPDRSPLDGVRRATADAPWEDTAAGQMTPTTSRGWC